MLGSRYASRDLSQWEIVLCRTYFYWECGADIRYGLSRRDLGQYAI
jgi:hypothetical protein